MEITKEMQKYIDSMLAKQKEEIELKINQSSCNKVELGCEVVDLIKIDGKPILDKETKVQKEINGQLAFYADKFIAKLTAQGLELETPIKKEQFDSLKIGSKCLAVGRLAIVTEFGNSVVKAVFNQFVEL